MSRASVVRKVQVALTRLSDHQRCRAAWSWACSQIETSEA